MTRPTGRAARLVATALGLGLAASLAACTGSDDGPSEGAGSGAAGTPSASAGVPGLRPPGLVPGAPVPATPGDDVPHLEVLPPIAQPGPAPGDADGAKSVITVVLPPRMTQRMTQREGQRSDRRQSQRRIILERWDNGRWTAAGSAPVTSLRRSFTVPRHSSPGVAGVYRARIVPGEQVTLAPVSTDQWGEPRFDDEFSGNALDPENWSHRQLGVVSDARECARTAKEAVTVGGGLVNLFVRPDPAASSRCTTESDSGEPIRAGRYLNAHISTEDRWDFAYGVASARVRFQQPQGQHGAFWIQRGWSEGTPGGPTRTGAEIDVAEYYGDGLERGGLTTFVHWFDDQGELTSRGRWSTSFTDRHPADIWSKQFHVYSVKWTPEAYVFYIDGVEVNRITEGLTGIDQFLVLSNLTSNWELPRMRPGQPDGRMSVDWVRVWQAR